jgi:hypothetical protein
MVSAFFLGRGYKPGESIELSRIVRWKNNWILVGKTSFKTSFWFKLTHGSEPFQAFLGEVGIPTPACRVRTMILQHLEDDPEPEAPGPPRSSQVGSCQVPQVKKIRQRLGYCQGMTLVAAVFAAAHNDAEVEVQKDGRLCGPLWKKKHGPVQK